MKENIFLIVISIFIISCGTSKFYTFDDTQQYIDQRFQDSLFTHAHWGVLIESLDDGEIWYERNADRMFMPASNQKILTSASALQALGPDFTFETQLYYTGEIKDSVLTGDIIVVGNGDPTFYKRFYDNPRDPFFMWADTLKKMGIKKIDGNIIGDDNAFDDQGFGLYWTFSYLDIYYAAECGALQFNENYVDLYVVKPASLEDSVEIYPNVESSYFTVVNKLTVVDSGDTRIYFDRPFGTNEITVYGTIAVGNDTIEISPSLWNPTLFYTTVLKETFINKGIEVTGNPVDCDDIDFWNSDSIDKKLILKMESPPLSEMLKILMKRSQNMYAETMAKTLGWKETGTGSLHEGRKVVECVLAGFGIEPDTYSYADGSGLSRYDYVSPRQIVKILKGMRQSEYWDTWYEVFPIAGVDGTIRNRMKGTRAERNVRAKTGTIANVRGLSGYVTTAEGEHLVFSFLLNGHLRSTRDTDSITDSVLELIAEYPHKKKDAKEK